MTEWTNMRPEIVPKATFPDYELTDHARTRQRLSKLQGDDLMILVLSRGHFCPKDHQQHLDLAAFYPKIAVAYTQIVTITTDNILELNEFRNSVGAQWTFLSDAGRKVQKDLDIQALPKMAEGTANKLFVVPSQLEDIAALGATFSAASQDGRPNPSAPRPEILEGVNNSR